ncbi:enoyl-CoA hydratase/isomerase family protein [Paraburkholderia fungorum]|jgi:2-(1,2-epoxy-1,2-dihydrophenyl)acetyl-CoA isomerase|uniref:enoyl-CoA hydratase/isomerase family protein n=1 Tax=Paraburkholderia fungorum TaxID=134537 RepID=UPI0000297225|nr:enoyl-CoA hydratase-related protein [Paraburkholderia fungorum]MBU7442069.1 enoyl-CoA hydratase/isomerase family protein [Paraburkholderia fungorum]
MTALIRLAAEDGIATLTFDRPEALNALNEAMANELNAKLARLAHHDDIRAIVLTGAGSAFMAGGDLQTMRAALDAKPAVRDRAIGTLVRLAQTVVETVTGSRKPVIASINGAVAGFGLSLVAACDLAIAAKSATFTSAYGRIGTSPDGGATYTLPRALGIKQAAQWMYLDERHSADEALRAGIVNWVVPDDELAAQTRSLLKRMGALSPDAFAQTKNLILHAPERSFAEHLYAEQRSFLHCAAGEDFREGVDAFFEKRIPVFGSSAR